jgi:hypothetical protein
MLRLYFAVPAYVPAASRAATIAFTVIFLGS